MDFKSFMQSVEHKVSSMKSESELRRWIENYARTIPADDREAFLEQFRKGQPHTQEEQLRIFIEWCEKVEDEDNEAYTLTCSGYESYGERYWDSEWVTEYEDPCGIGAQIEAFYGLAEQCVYDADYKAASLIYGNLGTLEIPVVDEDMGEYFGVGIEELVSEKLVHLNLAEIAALTLYTAYQVGEPSERAARLYGYFSRDMFRTVKLEDMMSVGSEPLEQLDEFIDSLILYLREQNDSYSSRLLIEAALYQNGVEGLLCEAKRNAIQHPVLFLEVLKEFYASASWDRLTNEGNEALQLMDRNMKIRGQAARLTAAGARRCNAPDIQRYAVFEAFISELSPGDFLRLITFDGMRPEKCNQAFNWAKKRYIDKEGLNESAYLLISFLAHEYDAILNRCTEQEIHLGWSGQFVNLGVPLLLLLLHRGYEWGTAMQAICSDICSKSEYSDEYEAPAFQELIISWKKQTQVGSALEKSILQYLQMAVDGRVEAIISGGHRNSYYKAAKLAAALGEVEQTLGVCDGKERRIQKYLKQFPRHRAFKDELKKYN